MPDKDQKTADAQDGFWSGAWHTVEAGTATAWHKTEAAAASAWNAGVTAVHFVQGAISLTPGAVLTRYWSGAWRNAGVPFTQDPDVVKQHVELSGAQLQKAEGEIYNSFKNISFIYAYHGSLDDLTTNTAIYKLGADERDYIGLKTDKNGKVTDFMNGTQVLGYLEDKESGARAAALRAKDGKITITIAGGALPTTSGWGPALASGGAVFASTGGNMTEQFKPVYDFAKSIEKKYGKIDAVDGHSLGGAVGECLVPAFPNAKFHLFDSPGLTKALEGHMLDFYSTQEHPLTAEQLKAMYHTQDGQGNYNVMRVRVKDNCYNTLGWIPADISITDPAQDHYNGKNPADLAKIKKGHLYGAGYYDAIRGLKNGNIQLHNNDVTNDISGGPTYITSVYGIGGSALMATTGWGTIANVVGAVEGLAAHPKDNPKPLSKSSPQR